MGERVPTLLMLLFPFCRNQSMKLETWLAETVPMPSDSVCRNNSHAFSFSELILENILSLKLKQFICFKKNLFFLVINY
jgi:hypothetical protein